MAQCRPFVGGQRGGDAVTRATGEGGTAQPSASEGEREAAVALLSAHIAELDEAKQSDDDDRWDEVASDGVELELAGATWDVWLGDDGWTASLPTQESEVPGSAMGFGEGDLIGIVGPATLPAEEIVRRLVTLERDEFHEN
jgi:hypothetical protein